MAKSKKTDKKKKNIFTRLDTFLLITIVIIALGFRLYRIDTPLADWHSWRQVDTAAVSRNFVQQEFNFLYPRYDDFSNVQSGQYNPEGYRFVEFPIYNSIFAVLYKYFPVIPIHMYGRLTSIVFSLFTLSIIYYLVKKEENTLAAAASALIFATFPFMVYYSRVVLPEPTALSMVFIAIFFLYLWKSASTAKKRSLWFVLSLLFAAMAILVKPTAIFYYLALAYIFFDKYRFSIVKRPIVYVYFALAIIPFAAWRIWISQFPEGTPGFEWLITSVNTFEGQKNIFFRPAYFRWIFYERILVLIMGGYAALLTVLGLIKKQKSYLFYALGASALAYLLVFQGGNVQHDYYQTFILPPLAIFTGLGISFILKSKGVFFNKLFSALVILFILGFSYMMSFETVKGFYNYSQDLVNVGNIINTLTPKDARVVTDRNGDTTLLYLANRRGMPSVADTLIDLKTQRGMEYFVTDKSDVAEQVKEEFELIFENGSVFIFKL